MIFFFKCETLSMDQFSSVAQSILEHKIMMMEGFHKFVKLPFNLVEENCYSVILIPMAKPQCHCICKSVK